MFPRPNECFIRNLSSYELLPLGELKKHENLISANPDEIQTQYSPFTQADMMLNLDDIAYYFSQEKGRYKMTD
jgi:hypothetical protein